MSDEVEIRKSFIESDENTQLKMVFSLSTNVSEIINHQVESEFFKMRSNGFLEEHEKV